ncbi:MAG: hypothetical protein H6880_11455 [Rhodobiaceae bacterium]|nr:hypothetical protein [Rhodobiaceae bacterium]
MDDPNMHAYGEDGPDDAEIGRRLRSCAHGVSLGADGMGWSPDPALLREAAAELERLCAENAALKHDLQYARDGLIRGRTRMREDNERLRAALAELLACHTESAGWSMSMLTDRAEFDAMLARSQERLHAAISAAREALGPNAI